MKGGSKVFATANIRPVGVSSNNAHNNLNTIVSNNNVTANNINVKKIK